ncbi:tripartite tricarboxylate transporter substrate binding protein [Leptospira sp. severe_002]|uniref:Bug family tripartite tricarboxylate transporter substrate binding protein n=1 Tax=Leptospira sp. severe_002 TaxID=2838237 RepID=UPI001E604EB7|nr:tripartite tricarboxylate transporter substrate binding protein [Leptospira sp. severe_002]
MRRGLSWLIVVFLTAALSVAAEAEDYPSRPIRFIVPFLAGGGVDVAARILGQKLADVFGQQVVIENRPGAGGMIGATAVAKAAPDGYTLLLGPGDFVTRPSLMPGMTFDPHKDLVPVAMVSSNPMLVVAGANAPYSNIKELIEAAQRRPGEIGYATPGNATLNHVAGEWMAAEAKIKLLHVPYRGGSAAANGIAAGDVPLGVVSPPVVQALIDTGRIKAIALTGKDRPPSAPASWPTLIESGLDVDAIFWVGLFAPANTPEEIMTRLDQETERALQDNNVRQQMLNAGLDPTYVGQRAFIERIRAEEARYDRILRQTGIRVAPQ